jgi:integrase
VRAEAAAFDKAACAIGLPGLTPHELRHTAADLAIESGATIQDIQAMLGHKDAALIIHRYGNHNDEGASRLAERMSRVTEKVHEQRRTSRGLNAM